MTGITPSVARMKAARTEFNDLARNLNPDLNMRIQQGKLSEEDSASPLVQKAAQAWRRYKELVHNTGNPEQVDRA